MDRQLVWGKLFLILTVLSCCKSLQVSIPKKEYEAEKGGSIDLTCSWVPANPSLTDYVLTWEVFPEITGDSMKRVATAWYGKPVEISPAYEGRASLDVDPNTRVSTLHLTQLTMQENRHFQCNVLIYGDDDGTTGTTTSLVVLVPPSPPICKLQGSAEYFQNVTLTCLSEEASPAPTYDWKSFSVDNSPRQFPPKATQKDGVLSLFNITRETSGYYICTSQNQIGSASCNFTLAVMPASMKIGSTAAIIGGVLAGLLVVGILIFCLCRRRSKKNKYPEGSPEEMRYYDQDAAEGEEPYSDNKSNSEKKQASQNEDNDVAPQNISRVEEVVQKFADDQYSYNSSKERYEGKGSDIDSHRYQDDQRDHYGGNRDRLDDQRERYGGSRDRLEDQRNRYGGSRDRLDEQHDRYGGSRDRLDDHRERYGGSRDRLDDHRERYGGSRDRLDDQRERYGGSRDRLDDQRERYGGSRDRLDDRRDNYRGSRDRLDDYSRHDRGDRYGGSRDRLDYSDRNQ
ncbi:cell surface A33 antigen-like [Astatotilapia calliptera]|uniref:cell surface A33 antigen-like n=1 Tax=Astatotilapia calliptera TaxID=8154 RepID=UPI000E41DBE6|nr:cell surface A33 antigen-like [Astatotilapia calliptera]